MAERDSWRDVARGAYWHENDARQLVEAWRQSGQSQAQFCRAHGIAVARLSRWVARLGKPTGMSFHPVRVAEVGRGGEALVVELPGVATIRLVPGFAVEDLRRILSALEVDEC